MTIRLVFKEARRLAPLAARGKAKVAARRSSEIMGGRDKPGHDGPF
jgi:hypothetical protein